MSDWAESSRSSHDAGPHLNLGNYFLVLGQYDKYLAESEEAQRLEANLDALVAYANRGIAFLALNRPDDAKATFEQALARKVDGGFLRLEMYYLAFVRGDSSQMEQQLAWGAGKPRNWMRALICFPSEQYCTRLPPAHCPSEVIHRRSSFRQFWIVRLWLRCA